MKKDIGMWIVAFIFTYPIIDGFSRWGSIYYYSDSYEKVEIPIDSARWVGRYNKSPVCFSNSYPDKIIYLTTKQYTNPIHVNKEGANTNYRKNSNYEVWNSPNTNYIYGVENNEDEFPKNKFLKYCLWGAIPIILFYGFQLYSFIKRRNKNA